MPDYRAEEVAFHLVKWTKHNRGMLVAVGGVVVIIVAVVLYGYMGGQEHARDAERLYAALPHTGIARLSALTDLKLNYSDTPTGVRITLDLADELYEQRQFTQAESAYSEVLTKYGESDIYAVRARLGLAYCAQEMRDYERARKLYEEVKTAGGLYATEAERMLKLLESPPTLPSNSVRTPTTVLKQQPAEESRNGISIED